MNPVKNEELKNAIRDFTKNSSEKNYVKLLNEVVAARLLIPVYMDRKPEYDEKLQEIVLEKDTQISFELIKSEKGSLYYPVFTDGAEMRKCVEDKDQQSLIVNFDDLAAMLLQPQNKVEGFSVNPLSDDIRFSAEMVEAMKKDMEKEKTEIE
ncbi:MAG: SseB family protein [Anaerovoracaceae bacterium]